MERFAWFKNETLRKALNARAGRDYDLAKQLLKQACEEGDPYANYFMGEALMFGGWGIMAQTIDGYAAAEPYLISSMEGGCFWGLDLFQSYCYKSTNLEFQRSINELSRRDDYSLFTTHDDRLSHVFYFSGNEHEGDLEKIIEMSNEGNIAATQCLIAYLSGYFISSYQFLSFATLGADRGDAKCQLLLANYYDEDDPNNEKLIFKWLKEAADQCHTESMQKLAVCYKLGSGCEVNMAKCAKLWLKLYGLDSDHIDQRIAGINDDLSGTRMHEAWRYGQAASVASAVLPIKPSWLKSIAVYIDTQSAVQKAIYCWMMIAKRVGSKWLNRDVVMIIAKLIWKTRKLPDIWI